LRQEEASEVAVCSGFNCDRSETAIKTLLSRQACASGNGLGRSEMLSIHGGSEVRSGRRRLTRPPKHPDHPPYDFDILLTFQSKWSVEAICERAESKRLSITNT
jgi:hypothetical protein